MGPLGIFSPPAKEEASEGAALNRELWKALSRAVEGLYYKTKGLGRIKEKMKRNTRNTGHIRHQLHLWRHPVRSRLCLAETDC